LVHANLVVLQEDDGFLVHGILALHRASHEVNRVRSVRFVVPRIVDVLPAVQVILCNTIISYYVYNTILLSASISIDSSDLLHYCYELQFI
jgi:phage gp36-like protein